jgi:hypothetical protein
VRRALVVQGNALALPLADSSVDLVVTSPPYFALRSYDAGPGEVGSEPTPAEFLAALWAATREMARVLKPGGSIWVNLGDKYTAGHGGSSTEGDGVNLTVYRNRPAAVHPSSKKTSASRAVVIPGTRPKSLLGLPWAYALGCTGMLATLGGPSPGLDLILRAEVVWHKTNGLPESVTDRVRRSHETWFHFTRSPRYYSALDELREEYAPGTAARYANGYGPSKAAAVAHQGIARDMAATRLTDLTTNPLGKLPGSVWSIPSEPLDLPDYLVRLPTGVTMMDAGPLWRHTEWMRRTGQAGPVLVRELDHYAAFPSEWPRRLVLGWSPPGICVECGQGRWPVVDRQLAVRNRNVEPVRHATGRDHESATQYYANTEYQGSTEARILGYACACTPHTDHPGTGGDRPTEHGRSLALGNGVRDNPGGGYGNAERTGPWREYHLAGWTPPPTRPAVVLDPFGGAGTTAAVGRALGRTVVTLDLSHDYSLAAQWRVRHAPTVAKTVTRTNADAQSRAVDPGPRVPVAPKPPTLTYRDAAAEQANRDRQGALL